MVSELERIEIEKLMEKMRNSYKNFSRKNIEDNIVTCLIECRRC
jgi:hypothetical protein